MPVFPTVPKTDTGPSDLPFMKAATQSQPAAAVAELPFMKKAVPAKNPNPEQVRAPAKESLLTFSGSIDHPDDDDREAYNLPEINMNVIRDQIKKNPGPLAEIENGDPVILKKLSTRIRQTLGFMKVPVQVWSSQELLDHQIWQSFLENQQYDLHDKKVEAVFILNSQGKNI